MRRRQSPANENSTSKCMHARSFPVARKELEITMFILHYEVPGSVLCGINARFVSPLVAKCKAIFELVQVN